MIEKNKIREFIQIVVIFFLFFQHGAALYRYEIADYRNFLVYLSIVLILVFCPRKSLLFNCIVVVCSLVLCRVFTSNGVGVGEIYIQLEQLCWMYLAVYLCEDRFAHNYVRCTFILSFISLIFYLITLISPQIFQSFATASYLSEYWTEEQYYVNVFYSYLQNSIRNTSIFTEPGIYQIVVNSAIFILLFCKNQIALSDQSRVAYLTVFIITIITAQSVTGYIALIVIILFFVFEKTEYIWQTKAKRRIMALLIGIIIFCLILQLLGVGYIFDDILGKVVSNGNIDLSQGSGKYRLVIIAETLKTIIKHPLGVGYGTATNIIYAIDKGAAGAAFMFSLMALGVGHILLLMLIIFSPMRFYKKSHVKFLVIFLYFNTTLAQSKILYPALIMLPILLKFEREYYEEY